MISTTLSSSSVNFTEALDYQKEELNIAYFVCEILVAVVAVVGNAMVILVFRRERRLRRRTNYYIVSLAAADFLVGLLGIPFAIMSSVGSPANLYACLFTVSLLVVLCTISIFCLVAVSVDRYWAILHPMGYSRNVRTKTALVIIGICWLAGSVIGFLPLMGWHRQSHMQRCFFLGVMDYSYLVFLYFGTIITPALLLAVFYAHIYHVVLKQLRQIVTINPGNVSGNLNGRSTGGTMLRMLGAAQKREVKATQNLSIIVLFFMVCWIPLYTINCILAFCRDCKVNSTFMLFCIILSHLNSAGNPLLYAYHLKDFRAALKQLICGSKQPPPNQNFAINNNFTHYRLQSLREARSALSLNRSKLMSESQLGFGKPRSHTLPTPPKISSLVSNSVALAAAAADANRDIWRISEASDERTLHKKYHSDDYEGDDDVFLEDTVPITELTCDAPDKSELVIPSVTIQKIDSISTPSPQPTHNVFLIENEMKECRCQPEFVRSASAERPKPLPVDGYRSPARSLKLSPFKAVGDFFRTNVPPRSCSLSEDEGMRYRNGYIPENHSCGS